MRRFLNLLKDILSEHQYPYHQDALHLQLVACSF